MGRKWSVPNISIRGCILLSQSVCFRFQSDRSNSEIFFHNRKLTSVLIVFRLNKTVFTHLNYNFDRIHCFLGLKTGSCSFPNQKCVNS